MICRVRKNGHSLALHLAPKELAALGIHPGDAVEITLRRIDEASHPVLTSNVREIVDDGFEEWRPALDYLDKH